MNNMHGTRSGWRNKHSTGGGARHGCVSGRRIRHGSGNGRRGVQGMSKGRSFGPPHGRVSPLQSGDITRESRVFGLDNDAVIQKLRFIKKKIFEMESASTAQSAPGKKLGRLRDKEKERYKITAVLDKKKCVNCGICADSCPENAISTNGDVRINPAKCNACGTCISVCPNEAISLPGKVRAAVS